MRLGSLLLSRCHNCILQAGLETTPRKYGPRIVGQEFPQLLSPPNRAVVVRYASSETHGTKDHHVVAPSKNLYFVTSNYHDSSLQKCDSPRPLVIILGWLLSRKDHLIKYANFYNQLGFDVLFTSLQARHLLWPSTGSQRVAKEILAFLGDNERYNSVFVHGFSAGGYLWGETMVEMCQHPDKYPDLRDRVKGHIWDSFVDWYGVPHGTSIAMFPRSRMLQKIVQKSIELYTWTFSDQTIRHYKESSRHFHYTPIKSPILYMGSKDDPIGTYDMLQNSAAMHVENGNQVFVKTWSSSPHVSHYLQHKEEYQHEVLKFLNFINLVTEVHRAAQDV